MSVLTPWLLLAMNKAKTGSKVKPHPLVTNVIYIYFNPDDLKP